MYGLIGLFFSFLVCASLFVVLWSVLQLLQVIYSVVRSLWAALTTVAHKALTDLYYTAEQEAHLSKERRMSVAVERAAAAAAAAAAGAGGGRMRAWRLHAYGGALVLERARVPVLRRPDELLVRVHAAGLNPLDGAMLRGYGARALDVLRALAGEAAPPLTPGRDVLGTVTRAGPAARLRPGQRVWAALPPHAQGSHAHYVLLRDAWAGAAPRALSDAEAGGAPYAALTACAALRGAGLAPGGRGAERVLLLGLGGVGQAVLQLLAERGARVTVSCAAELHALAARLGAEDALDRHAPDAAARLARAPPFHAVLDCAGLGGAAPAAALAPRYVTLTSPLLRETDARGLAVGTCSAAAQLLAQNVRAAARAGGGGGARVRWAFFSAGSEDLELVRALADAGRVERVFPWWAAAEAYERAARGAARGKLVLDFMAEESPGAMENPSS